GISIGPVAAAAWNPWLICLTFPGVIYATWVVAVAWDHTRGPIIEAEVEPPRGHITHLRVRNAGGGMVRSRAWLKRVEDENDRPRPEVTSEVELYWSDNLDRVRLFGRADGLATLVSTAQTPEGHRLLVNTIIPERSGGGVTRKQGCFFVGDSG